MKKYFVNCKSLEELKKEYKKLAMMYHPDRPTGDLRIMQEVNAEYEIMFNILKERQEAKEDKINNECASDFMEIIDQLINCQGITIEICGSWVWVGGDTKPYKDLLGKNGLGFAWRSKKQMWSLGEFTGRKHKEWSMDRIRDTYGSQKVETKKAYCLQ